VRRLLNPRLARLASPSLDLLLLPHQHTPQPTRQASVLLLSSLAASSSRSTDLASPSPVRPTLAPANKDREAVVDAREAALSSGATGFVRVGRVGRSCGRDAEGGEVGVALGLGEVVRDGGVVGVG